MGYLRIEHHTGKIIEADTLKCSHCEQHVLVNKWKQNGGRCGSCFKPICIRCAQLLFEGGWVRLFDGSIETMAPGVCIPLKKQIERALTKDARRRVFPI